MAPTSQPHAAETPWWALDEGSLVEELGTDTLAGLADTEAARRSAAVGPNELEVDPVRAPLLILGAQFANTMIVVLLLALVVTVAVGEVSDAIVIAAIVLLNAVIGFVQEYRAERAMAALRDMAAPDARVVRDGVETTIAAVDLVPGDVIVLEAGDVCPADARLLESPDLRVSEAALTGESVPVDKTADPIDAEVGRLVADRRNMVFKGTAVVHGRARAVVVAIAMSTALGQIAGLLEAHGAPRTPLQRRLASLGRWLALGSVAVCVLVFLAGIARGEDADVMLLTSVSLAVAAIPESLPAVVTIALALGAGRLVDQHALVRKLPAVETLGSVTVICADKTGTLTQGRMFVERVWTTAGEVTVTGSGYEPVGSFLTGDEAEAIEGVGTEEPLGRLLMAAGLCNDAALLAPSDSDDWSVAGDPTEGALLVLAAKAGFEPHELHARMPRVGEVTFDSVRKHMTTAHVDRNTDRGLVAVKGALEALLDMTASVATIGGDRPLDADSRRSLEERAALYAADGYRVLAVAGRDLSARPTEEVSDLEDDLVLYGLVAMADPARAESAEAVASCRRAGIVPVMITGDHPTTARAIATDLGMLVDHEVMTGSDLLTESEDGLTERVARVAVYARTSPEQKLDIVRAWKRRGELVAMTGDGVNDAPALQAADIGVAMGINGTEVAKEAAEMVLTDDNFATVVDAIVEGRRVYDNIRRFVRYTLTSNTGEIWVMILGPFVGLSLPLLPVQILWINLVTDGLPGLALGVEPAERDVMQRPPRAPDETIFARGLWQHVLAVGLVMGLVPLALGVWGEATGRPWQTMIFSSLALLQLGHALGVRSETDSLRSLGLGTNRFLLAAVSMTVMMQLAVVYWAPLQEMFDTEALTVLELAVVLTASTIVLAVVELEKSVRRRSMGT